MESPAEDGDADFVVEALEDVVAGVVVAGALPAEDCEDLQFEVRFHSSYCDLKMEICEVSATHTLKAKYTPIAAVLLHQINGFPMR